MTAPQGPSSYHQSEPSISAKIAGGVPGNQSLASENHLDQRNHYCGDHMRISHGPYARKIRGNSRNVLWCTRDVAYKVQDIANATYDGDASKAKALAEDAGSSPRAAENWLAGDNPMSLTAFLNAYHNNPTFKAWARKLLLLEEEHNPEFQAQLAAFIRAAQRVSP